MTPSQQILIVLLFVVVGDLVAQVRILRRRIADLERRSHHSFRVTK